MLFKIGQNVPESEIRQAPVPPWDAAVHALLSIAQKLQSKADLPLGELASTSSSASIGTNSLTIVDTGIAATAVVRGTRKIKITVSLTVQNGLAGANTAIQIWRGAVGTGTLVQDTLWTPAGNGYLHFTAIVAIDNPGAGTHVYRIGYKTGNVSGSVNIRGDIGPTRLVVEEI